MNQNDKYTLDTSSAVKSMEALAKAFGQYEEKLLAARDAQKAAASAGNLLAGRIGRINENAKLMNSQIRSAAGRLSTFNERTTAAHGSIAKMGRAAGKLTDQFANAIGIIREANKQVQNAANLAARFVTDERKAAAAVELFNLHVQQQQQILSEDALAVQQQIETSIRIGAVKRELSETMLHEYSVRKQLEAAVRDGLIAEELAQAGSLQNIQNLSQETQAFILKKQAAIQLKAAVESMLHSEQKAISDRVTLRTSTENLSVATELLAYANGQLVGPLSLAAQAEYNSIKASRDKKAAVEALFGVQDQATARSERLAESQKRLAVAQELAAAAAGTLRQPMSQEAQTLLNTELATLKKERALKKLTETERATAKEEDAIAEANKRHRLSLELLTYSVDKNWQALSMEAKIYVQNERATRNLKKAKEQLYAQENKAEKQAKRLAAADDKLRIARELQSYTLHQDINLLSLDTQAVLKNAEAQIIHKRAMDKIIAGMTGKNMKLTEQEKKWKKDTAAAGQNARMLQGLRQIWDRLSRTLGNFLGYGTWFLFWRELRESIGNAREYARAVAEIRTISDRATVSTGEWHKQLMLISNATGQDFLKVTEAAYQSLSNQITTSTDTFTFLREAMALSYTTTSSLESSVNALSSVINAFGQSSKSASSDSAILFRMVELGRLRLEDVANILGRVSILSDELGVSFLEQSAALSLLTRNGIPAEEALTLLRNVEQKLIRPTDAMKEKFEEWGFTSGVAAARTLGLVGVMQRLAQESAATGDMAAEMGELFGRLRAIVGSLALEHGDLAAETEKYADASQRAYEALLEQIDSTAVRADRASVAVQNFFVAAFGEPILERLLDYVDTMGGAAQATQKWVVRGGKALVFLGTYRASLAITNTLMRNSYTLSLLQAQGMSQTAIAARSATAALNGLRIVQGATTLGLTAVASYLIMEWTGLNDQAFLFESKLIDIQSKLERIASLTTASRNRFIDVNHQEILKSLDLIEKKFGTVTANLLRQNTAATKKIKDDWDAIDDVFSDLGKNVGDMGKSIIDELTKAVDALETNISNLESSIIQTAEALQLDQLAFDLEGMGAEAAITTIRGEIAQAQAELEQFAIDSNIKEFQRKRKHLEDLYSLERQLINDSLQERVVYKAVMSEDGTTHLRDKYGRFRYRKVEEVPAEDEIKVQEQLHGLAAERLDVMKKIQLTEEALLAAQKQQRDLSQQDLDEKQAALQKFQEILAELDTAEIGDIDPAAFRQRVAEARQAGIDMGVDPGQLAQLLQEAFAKALLAERQQKAETQQEAIKQVNDLITQNAQYMEDLEQKRLDAEKRREEITITEAPQKLTEAVVKLQEVLKQVDMVSLTERTPIGGAQFYLSQPIVDELADIQRQIYEVTKSDQFSPAARQAVLGELTDRLIQLGDKIEESLRGTKDGNQYAFSPADKGSFSRIRNPYGDILYDPRVDPNDPQSESLSELFKNIDGVKESFIELQKTTYELNELQKDAKANQLDLNNVLDLIPVEYQQQYGVPGVNDLDVKDRPTFIQGLQYLIDNLQKAFDNRVSNVNFGDIHVNAEGGINNTLDARRVAGLVKEAMRQGFLT